IRHMDKIYDGAIITIIATAGGDADLGFPGVSGATRPRQRFITIGGRRFSVLPDLTEEVRKSTWSTRGWTYQDSTVFSPRTASAGTLGIS
ncbi:hypothetical protein B0T25DRAFT_445723, partial [Lasiosphaeria hispida]